MKCYYHPKEDAVAVCKSCGRGTCQECTVIVSGISYCKTCVETSRVPPPVVQLPTPPISMARPSGVPNRSSFIVGAVGVIISGVAAVLSLFAGFGLWWFFGSYLGGAVFTIVGFILGVGVILAGIGYLGIRKNYGPGTGAAGFALGIVTAVFLFASVAFSIIYESYRYSYYYYYYSPWYSILVISTILTLILFGVTQILWGIAHINSRRYTGKSGLTMATGIILIISGALTASVLISFAGLVLFFVGGILALLVFLMSNIPGPQVRTA